MACRYRISHTHRPRNHLVATLSYAELEGLWLTAGGSKSADSMAAAIAMAESTGSTTAMNGQYVSGLWQINTAPNANPEYTVAQMQNPLANAKAAVAISKNGTDWTPWQTYTNGAYLQFLKSGVKATGTKPPISQSQILKDIGMWDPSFQGAQPGSVAWNTLSSPKFQQEANTKAALKGLPGPFSTTPIQAVIEDLLPLAGLAIGGLMPEGGLAAASSAGSAAKAAASSIGSLTGVAKIAAVIALITDPKMILRILEVIGGGLLLLMALNETVKAAGGTSPVATIGKATR